ncbi:hypothetical protein JTR59_003159 [Escherichia coli]|nr:hypothetical protein [Escherichia coli]HAN6501330.1 hypothetical protein [Escherichia coli]HAN6522267.1 hypothetical protein [Escherichia coli]
MSDGTICWRVFPAPAGINAELVVAIGKQAVFPAPAGINRIRKFYGWILSGVPRASGDKPSLMATR